MLLLTSNHGVAVQAEILRALSPEECGRLLQERHRLPQASRELVVERSMEVMLSGARPQR
jgi:uncharacterized Zn finger protein